MIEFVYVAYLVATGKHYKVFDLEADANEYQASNPLLVAEVKPKLKARFDLVIRCTTVGRSTGDDRIAWVKLAYDNDKVKMNGVSLQDPAIQKRLADGGYKLKTTKKDNSGVTYFYAVDPFHSIDESGVIAPATGALGCADVDCPTSSCACVTQEQRSPGYDYSDATKNFKIESLKYSN